MLAALIQFWKYTTVQNHIIKHKSQSTMKKLSELTTSTRLHN